MASLYYDTEVYFNYTGRLSPPPYEYEENDNIAILGQHGHSVGSVGTVPVNSRKRKLLLLC